jgi:flavin-dependent dehydrogenase
MTMDEKFHGGYGWIFPHGDEYNIGVGSPQGILPMLKTYCKSLDIDITKKKSYHAGVVPYRFTLTSHTLDGAAIIGDAAGLTNPTTGGGIHAALYSGNLIATHTINTLEKEDYTKIHAYTHDIKNTQFLNPIHQKTSTYFMKWTNTDWEFFGNAANGLDMNDLTLLKSFLIGLKYPRYLLRARELLTIRKEMQLNQKYGF